MARIIAMLFVFALSGCATKKVHIAPIHKLDIQWQIEDNRAILSMNDYNKLGLWLMDVKRFINEQSKAIEELQ